MTERGLVGVNYEYPRAQHERWKAAADRKGQSLKEWIRRALNEAADAQAESERKRPRP